MKIIILTLCCVACSMNVGFAQKQKPVPSVSQPPREFRSDEKKDELSKKLLKRKNELREEEHEKKHHNAEAKEKSNNPK